MSLYTTKLTLYPIELPHADPTQVPFEHVFNHVYGIFCIQALIYICIRISELKATEVKPEMTVLKVKGALSLRISETIC